MRSPSTGYAVRAWVGGGQPLAGTPGGLELDVLVGDEHRDRSFPLPVGEEVGAGVRGPLCGVRIALASAVTVWLVLGATAALVQHLCGKADDVGRGFQQRHSGGGNEVLREQATTG